jgi:hypothetical protein
LVVDTFSISLPLTISPPDALGEGIGMNSRNHHMISSYSGYLISVVAGDAITRVRSEDDANSF